MKAQLELRMKYRLAAVRKRHYVPHGSGARARAKFQFIVESKQYSLIVGAIKMYTIFGMLVIFFDYLHDL